MTEITLVLPFALPPPELAFDLVRELKAPGLAALLSRTATADVAGAGTKVRALPHEQWLARTFGLSSDAPPAYASAAMRGFGLDPAEGTWFIVNPAHIAVARSHLMMNDLRRLALSDAHSRALFATAHPFFDELGHTLLYAGADTWFMRADGWAGMDTATPDCAAGMNLTEWLPLGEHAIAYRKLQNEVQMLWHNHPANVERESRQLATVNAFWLWGGATAADTLAAAPALVCLDAPAWLSALPGRGAASVTELLGAVAGKPAPQARQDALLYCGSVAEAALAADWGLWLQQMAQLDCDLFAPLHAALLAGRVKQLRLVLGRRDALAELTTTQMAQRKFWRRPTLDRLLP